MNLSCASDADELVVPELFDETLKELFSTAAPVLKVRPWERLSDTTWMGVRDPDSGRINIVAVMGAGGQFYAVQVYLPEEGVHFWNEFLRNDEVNHYLARHRMRMVSCEFVAQNGEDMDETDFARNDTFGPPEFGKSELDSFLFRSTLPGCMNWHPAEVEIPPLLDALRLIPGFMKKLNKLPQKCYATEPGEDMPWIPCYQLSDSGDRKNPINWTLETVPFPVAEVDERILPDDLFPGRLSQFQVEKNSVWQIATNSYEKAVIEDGRPTLLSLTAVGVEGNGMAAGAELIPSSEPLESMLRKSFLSAAKEVGSLPEVIKVRSDLAEKVFQNLPGITVERCPSLPLIEGIMTHVAQSQGLSDQEDHPLADISESGMREMQALLASLPAPHEMKPGDLQDLMSKVASLEGGEEIMNLFSQMSGGEAIPTEFKPLQLVEEDDEVVAVETGERFELRVDLEYSDPPIWRRLAISTGATFDDLHVALQKLFDWEMCHLHCFEKRSGRKVVTRIGDDPEYDDKHGSQVLLKNLFKRKGSKVYYIYDFGDDWTHLITLEKKIPAKKGETKPICLDGSGIAPPEDCGGMWGFQELLDPDSGYAEDYDWDPEDLHRYREGKFDPASVKFL